MTPTSPTPEPLSREWPLTAAGDRQLLALAEAATTRQVHPANWSHHVRMVLMAGPARDFMEMASPTLITAMIEAHRADAADLEAFLGAARQPTPEPTAALREALDRLVGEVYETHHTPSSESGPEEWDYTLAAPSIEAVEQAIRVLAQPTPSAAPDPLPVVPGTGGLTWAEMLRAQREGRSFTAPCCTDALGMPVPCQHPRRGDRHDRERVARILHRLRIGCWYADVGQEDPETGPRDCNVHLHDRDADAIIAKRASLHAPTDTPLECSIHWDRPSPTCPDCVALAIVPQPHASWCPRRREANAPCGCEVVR